MTRALSKLLPTQLPAQYERMFAWRLDRRCKDVRDVAADLYELWQDLGGVENLSAQKRWLCERVVYLRRRMLAYESAVMAQDAAIAAGTEPPKLPMDAGTYSNFANVMQGYLKSLGLERKARPAMSLEQFIAGAGQDGAAENAASAPRSDRPSPNGTAPPEEIAADTGSEGRRP